MKQLQIGLTLVSALFLPSMMGCEFFGGYRPGTFATGTVVLNVGVPLETSHNTVVRTSKRVEQPGGKGKTKHHRFSLLFGPNPPAPGEEWGKGHGWIINSAPTWHVEEGYVYGIGWWPIITTNRVRAISEGTMLIVQVLPDKDRLFLLDPGKKTRVNVELNSDPSMNRWLTFDPNQRFIETIQGDENTGLGLSEPTAIPDDEETQRFLNHVLSAAGTADL